MKYATWHLIAFLLLSATPCLSQDVPSKAYCDVTSAFAVNPSTKVSDYDSFTSEQLAKMASLQGKCGEAYAPNSGRSQYDMASDRIMAAYNIRIYHFLRRHEDILHLFVKEDAAGER